MPGMLFKRKGVMRTIHDCPVVVVGGAGFLGSHLVDHLIKDRGCNVLVIDNLAAGRLEFVNEDADFLHHDITGSEIKLLKTFKGFGARFVLNYAAMPYVPDSYAHPIRVNDVNFMGALKVVNAAQEAGVEAILQVSSAEVYGDAGSIQHAVMKGNPLRPDECDFVGYTVSEPIKLDERARVVPHSSYGASKAAIDALVQVRWREAKTPCIALRQFNCVGERETHDYVIPTIISQLAKLKPYPSSKYDSEFQGTVKLGNNSFRDFIYAGDAVRIAVELLERGQFGEVYNLGSETGIKMYDLTKLIGKVMGFADVRIERDEARVRPWEIWHLQSCNNKLVKEVYHGAEDFPDSLVPLEEALRRTVKWYEENGRKWGWER